MDIPELIITLDLKMKLKEEEIAEDKRKSAMKEYDLENHKIAIRKIVEPKE